MVPKIESVRAAHAGDSFSSAVSLALGPRNSVKFSTSRSHDRITHHLYIYIYTVYTNLQLFSNSEVSVYQYVDVQFRMSPGSELGFTGQGSFLRGEDLIDCRSTARHSTVALRFDREQTAVASLFGGWSFRELRSVAISYYDNINRCCFTFLWCGSSTPWKKQVTESCHIGWSSQLKNLPFRTANWHLSSRQLSRKPNMSHNL